MANKRYSERERLFKLIRGDENTLKNIQRRKGLEISSKQLKEFVFFVKQKLLEIFHKLRKGEISFPKLNLLLLNKVLMGILSIMVIYFVFDFASGVFLQKEVIYSAQRTTPNHGKPASGQAQMAKLSPLSYYLGQVGGKELFNPKRIELIKAKAWASSAEPIANLKLVGVDWGGNPVALIEDTKTQKTYFVKKGESVKDLMVMEIFRDRVRLRYDNKVLELK